MEEINAAWVFIVGAVPTAWAAYLTYRNHVEKQAKDRAEGEVDEFREIIRRHKELAAQGFRAAEAAEKHAAKMQEALTACLVERAGMQERVKWLERENVELKDGRRAE